MLTAIWLGFSVVTFVAAVTRDDKFFDALFFGVFAATCIIYRLGRIERWTQQN